jgi:hypothetical protein
MWALQQGHTDVAAVLLQHGANPRVATAFGVTPLVLATYAANGASRPLVEEALAGRAIRATDWFRSATAQPAAVVAQPPTLAPGTPAAQPQPGVSWTLPAAAGAAQGVGVPSVTFNAPAMPGNVQGAVAPSVTLTAPSAVDLLRGQGQPGVTLGMQPDQRAPAAPLRGPSVPSLTVSQPSLAGALEPEPLSLMSRSGVGQGATGVLQPLQGRGRADGGAAIAADPSLGWRRLSDIAGHFGTTYHHFVLENSQLPPAEAANDPDVVVGKAMGTTLSRALQSRDLARARTELEGVRAAAPTSSRFKLHMAAMDETLQAMGH